jgi:hypothetical protein
MKIPRAVSRHVDSTLRPRLIEHVNAREWGRAFLLPASTRRVSFFIDLAVAGIIPRDEWARLLPDAISTGDLLRYDRDRLLVILTALRASDETVFDGDAARAAYVMLPNPVTIYRGTVVAEAACSEYGVSWTLDPEQARWFATAPHRCRNWESPPLLLSATVARENICGLLFGRQEREVLVCPHALQNIRLEMVLDPICGCG